MTFPTGPVDGGTLYTDEYGNVFRFNINTGAWEKYLGDEYGEPVLTSGATMFGDLVQTPSSGARPQLPGELSINRVDDTKIQFRYQGGDLATHGFDMDLDCVEDITQDLIITSDSVDEGNVFAQFGEALEVLFDGQIAGGDQSARTFMWERSDSIADGSIYVDTGITTETYTILESDRGKFLRRRDTWTGTGTCGGTFIQRSNAMPVVFQLPTPTAYMGFTKSGGTGSLVLTLTGPSIVYKIDATGAWESVENFAAGTRTIHFNDATTKTYAFESQDMTHFKWVAGDDNFNFTIDSRSLTPALISLYQSFANQPLFNQHVNFLQTANVSNMDEAFADSPSFSASAGFDHSKITTARGAFRNCTGLSYNETFTMAKLVNASEMFRNCDNIVNTRVRASYDLRDTSNMFHNCKKWSGSMSLYYAPHVVYAQNMFANCYEYTGSSDSVSSWGLGELVNARGMFRGCRKFNPEISQSVKWQKMQKLVNASWMFYGCTSFNQYWLNNWNLTSCTNMYRMFDGCVNLRATFSNMISVSLQDTTAMFDGTREISGLGTWSPYTQNIKSMYGMFRGYQYARLYGVGDWNTTSLEEGGLDRFLYGSQAWQDMHNWRTQRIPERPSNFADSSNMGPFTSYSPKWGVNPPNFAWSESAGASHIGKMRNESHPNRVSGEGQPGDVLRPTYSMEGGTATKWRWCRSGQSYTNEHPDNPNTPTFTVTADDRGRDIWVEVTATNPEDGSTSMARIKSYKIAGSSRSRSTTAYSVTTRDNEKGESVQVNLQFTGTDPVGYYKMNEDGEDELVGTLLPGSPKVLSLPAGVWTWEANNMTAIDYSESPEETEFFIHSISYDPTSSGSPAPDPDPVPPA